MIFDVNSVIYGVVIVLFGWITENSHVNALVEYKKGAPQVTLPNGGVLAGKVDFSRDGRPFNSFMGIQYATVPERFQEAKLITSPTWQGTYYNATSFGPSCAQDGYIGDAQGEDECLYLNVYVPLTNSGVGKRGLPVMVWIHGGGFRMGSSDQFNPVFFMDEDVILITINYRLGLFGFLSTGDDVIPGNNGLKDMVLALKWIQQSVSPFGGDSSKVTIFGESAGGVAVQYLMLSPTTKGLYHRAISQSGSALSFWGYNPNPRKSTLEFISSLDCQTTAQNAMDISSQEIADCLKRFSNEELIKALGKVAPSWPPRSNLQFLFVPSCEPSEPVSELTPFLAEPPISILTNASHSLPEIPYMTGATEAEGNVMWAGVVLSDPNLIDELNKNWETLAPTTFDFKSYLPEEERKLVANKIRQFYFGDQDISEANAATLIDLYSDNFMLHGIYRSAVETARKSKRNPVYFYQYDYKGPISLTGYFMQVKGEATERVGHGDDLVLEFPLESYLPHLQPIIKADTEDEQFSKNFIRLLTSFAIHGEPEHEWGAEMNKEWKPISKKQLDGVKPITWYKLKTNPASVEVSQSVLDRMQFWDSVWTEHIAPAIENLRTANSGIDQGKNEL